MNKITFFTPANFNLGPKSIKQAAMQLTDAYFAFGGKIANVWQIHPDGKSYEAHLVDSGKASFAQILLTALKVVSYMTILIPALMLLAKAIFRYQHPIYITPVFNGNMQGQLPPPPQPPNQPFHVTNHFLSPTPQKLKEIHPPVDEVQEQGVEQDDNTLPEIEEEHEHQTPRLPPKEKEELDAEPVDHANRDIGVVRVPTMEDLIEFFRNMAKRYGKEEIDAEKIRYVVTKLFEAKNEPEICKQKCQQLLTRIHDVIPTCSEECKKEFIEDLILCHKWCLPRLYEVCSSFLFNIDLPSTFQKSVPYLYNELKNQVLLSMADKVKPGSHHVNFRNICKLRIGREIHLEEACIKNAELDVHILSDNKILLIQQYPKVDLLKHYFLEYTEERLLERICEEINHPLRKELRNQILDWLADQLTNEEVETAALEANEDPDLYAETLLLKKYSSNPSNEPFLLNASCARLLVPEELLLLNDQDNILREAVERDALELQAARREEEAHIAKQNNAEEMWMEYDEMENQDE